MTRKLINFNIDLEALARIDAEAHRHGMNRTTYFLHCCDPGKGERTTVERSGPKRGDGGARVKRGLEEAIAGNVTRTTVQVGPRTFRPGERLKPR
jgi:hypothetical protein